MSRMQSGSHPSNHVALRIARVLAFALPAMLLTACRAPDPAAGRKSDTARPDASQAMQAPEADIVAVETDEVAPVESASPVAGDDDATVRPAKSAPAADAGMPKRLRVVGNEPFWGIRIKGDRLHFTTLDDQQGRHLIAAQNAEADGASYSGTDDGAAFTLRIARATCSDGMSDRTYAYTATFRHGGTDYRGCADSAELF